jgi:diguanylate cyclase (GGDEF)-like protein
LARQKDPPLPQEAILLFDLSSGIDATDASPRSSRTVTKKQPHAGPPPAATKPQKLAFLRGNLKMLIVWPVAALILCGIGWWAILAKLDEDRRDIEATALREAAALSRSYADHLARTLEVVDQITLHVKYEWELSKGSLKLEAINEKGLFPLYSRFYVAIIDRNGMPVTSTMPLKHPAPVLADRQYFSAQKEASVDFLYIGVPVIGKIVEKHVIQFSRRLWGRDNSFDGVVLASIIPDYFSASYDEAILGQHGFMGFIGTDDLLRVTRVGPNVLPPEAPALLTNPVFSSISGAELFDGPHWFADKRNRYLGWHAVEGFPMTAMVGMDQETALAGYWRDRASSLHYAFGATFAIFGFVLIGIALSMRLAWRKYQLEEVRATYRMATEEGNEGFYIARLIKDRQNDPVDFQILDCNHRGAELLQMRREELLGKRISGLYSGEGLAGLMWRMNQAMELGFHESELDVPNGGPMSALWLHLRIVRSGADLAITMRDISDTKAHVEALERRSNEDSLTGLPNRNWVQNYLPLAIQRAAESESMLAVLFVDLDGFKAVNDSAGHSAGDELLRHAAQRLKVAVRPHDKVVRLGGDEFVVILEQLAATADAAQVAGRVVTAFKEQFRISEGIFSVGTSIGISVYPADGKDARSLLQSADIAMYSVKTTGKGSLRFYDPKFYEALRARLDRESELRRALANDELIVYYQPRVDILTGVTASMEALVRWQHPAKGLLEPLEFIPLAEETGLILPIGEIVIEKVCAQLEQWAGRGHDLVPVSINISPRQFNDPNITKVFADALKRHNIDPSLIEIELTESSMMGDNQDVCKALASLQEMGVKLLVDDFGTGYSSLSQLQRLDFDVLKVDRAFTSEVDKTDEGRVFFTAIVTMAHALGMRVVAEGVENAKQIGILKVLQCDEIQGFYLCRPVAPGARQPILPRYSFAAI